MLCALGWAGRALGLRAVGPLWRFVSTVVQVTVNSPEGSLINSAASSNLLPLVTCNECSRFLWCPPCLDAEPNKRLHAVLLSVTPCPSTAALEPLSASCYFSVPRENTNKRWDTIIEIGLQKTIGIGNKLKFGSRQTCTKTRPGEMKGGNNEWKGVSRALSSLFTPYQHAPDNKDTRTKKPSLCFHVIVCVKQRDELYTRSSVWDTLQYLCCKVLI